MKIEKGIISGGQFMILIVAVLQASTLTSAFITVVTKQDTWIFILISSVITAFLLFVYTSLGIRFAGKNLIQINSLIYGNFLGSIVSIMYIFFFWLIIPANSRLLADFFTTFVFSNLDIHVFAIGIIIICAYAVGKGIETIARISIIIVIITSITAIALSVLTVNEMRLSNFLPIFQVNLKQLIQGLNLMVVIPLGEIVVVLMIFPYFNRTTQMKRYSFSGFIIGAVYFFVISLRNTAVLGSIGSISAYPAYELARLINIGEVITRAEIVLALILLANIFLKISTFYYATVLSIAQLLKLRSYKPLVIPVGIISIVLIIGMFDSPVEEIYWATNIYPIYAIPFVILFPIISLIIAYIRGIHRKY